MSESEQEPPAGQGGGTDGPAGNELETADETVARPDLDPDAWDAKPADAEHHHDPHGDDPPDERGFAGEDEGMTAGETPGER